MSVSQDVTIIELINSPDWLSFVEALCARGSDLSAGMASLIVTRCLVAIKTELHVDETRAWKLVCRAFPSSF